MIALALINSSAQVRLDGQSQPGLGRKVRDIDERMQPIGNILVDTGFGFVGSGYHSGQI